MSQYERTDDDLKKLALAAAGGDLFTSADCDPNVLPIVFMPLALMSSEDHAVIDALPKEHQPWLFFEYCDKAGPRAINGCPIFFSVQWIVLSQRDRFIELVKKAQAGLKKVQEEL